MNTKKKESKSNKAEKNPALNTNSFGSISNKTELKTFLLSIRDRMTEELAAPIYAMAAMNYILSMPEIYSFLENENKEIARDIWLRLKQAGFQLRSPSMLFEPESDSEKAGATQNT